MVFGGERRPMGQTVRFQETLRRLAMIDEGFVEDQAGLGAWPGPGIGPGSQDRGVAASGGVGGGGWVERRSFACRDRYLAGWPFAGRPRGARASCPRSAGQLEAGEAQVLRGRLSTERGPSAAGASALTAAELRLLPMLATHQSFPEIAGEMFLSRHTIKSQAVSIYRKLGASSRSQAVARSRELGLLEG